MRNLIASLLLLTTLAACGGLTGLAASAIIGGGPRVDSQIGQDNVRQNQLGQQIITTRDNSRVDLSHLKSDNVDNVTINDTNFWIIVLLILGWLLPSPGEMWRGLLNAFKRK